MTIADELRSALNCGDIFLEYLPTLRLSDAHCIGAEALARWRRGRSVLPAAAFIPLIDNTPLSGTLTYWVVDTVAAELGEWLGAHTDIHVSINVPPEVLGRGGVEYAAVRSGLSAHIGQVIFEITERGVPDRLGLEALKAMAKRGVRLALDDTMMSGVNLALLTRSDFEMLKLDRELIAQIQADKPLPDWMEGLGSLLRTTSLQVVAEGVETEYQAERLYKIGVQIAQGHFFSVPLNARGLMEFCAEDRQLGFAASRA